MVNLAVINLKDIIKKIIKIIIVALVVAMIFKLVSIIKQINVKDKIKNKFQTYEDNIIQSSVSVYSDNTEEIISDPILESELNIFENEIKENDNIEITKNNENESIAQITDEVTVQKISSINQNDNIENIRNLQTQVISENNKIDSFNIEYRIC